MSPRTCLPLRVLTLAGLAAPPATAQTWVPLFAAGSQQPGKPAQVTLNASKSNSTYTSVDILIFGFWREQWRWNTKCEDGYHESNKLVDHRMNKIEKRLAASEKTSARYAGALALLGSIIGALGYAGIAALLGR